MKLHLSSGSKFLLHKPPHLIGKLRRARVCLTAPEEGLEPFLHRSIGKGKDALSVDFTIPEFTDVFGSFGTGLGAKTVMATFGLA